MNSPTEGAKLYFDSVPAQWDALYSHENRFRYAFNRIMRRGLFQRYELTFDKCGQIPGSTVLEMGCGTGRYSIEFAKRGAAGVVGIDFAPSMIEFSQGMAKNMGVENVSTFMQGDVRTLAFHEPFDVVLAIGLFDYIADAESVVNVAAQLTSRVFLCTFPTYSVFRGFHRKIRYNWIRRCPIYYYTSHQIQRMVRPYFRTVDVISISGGFFVSARKN